MRTLLIFALLPLSVHGQLEWRSEEPSPVAFAKAGQNVLTAFSNSTNTEVDVELSTRIFLLSSATAVPLGEARPWKRLKVLPGQTILEKLTVDFPDVKVPTRFRIQCIKGTSDKIGQLDVTAYPDNLLKSLQTLADGKPVGILDPGHLLIPLLKQQKVEFEELKGSEDLDHFKGRLAVLGPFGSADQIPAGLESTAVGCAKSGRAIVWIEPASRKLSLAPSARVSVFSAGTVVAAQAGTVSSPSDSPTAQLNLVRLCEMAIDPARFQWPAPPIP